MTARAHEGNGARVTVLAIAATTVGVLPVWLTGGLSVLIREQLAFDEQQLGFAVAAFFLASAIASVPGGRVADQLGARRSMVAASTVTATTLLAITLLPGSFSLLAATLIVAGAANGLLYPAVNLAIAENVAGRRGLAFGLKQSAIPTATLLTGVALPLVGGDLGWRSAFVAATIAASLVTVSSLRILPPTARTKRPGSRTTNSPRRELFVIALAASLGSGAGNALAAFLVPSAVASGLDAPRAGVALIAASIACIVSRVAVGWRADLRVSGHLGTVASMVALGAIGLAVLAWGGGPPAVLILGGVLAFAAGWGWAGLLNYTVVERNPDGPAAATGILQVGVFTGAVVGPSLFGTLVVEASYTWAWIALALAAGGAALLFLAVHRQSPSLDPTA